MISQKRKFTIQKLENEKSGVTAIDQRTIGKLATGQLAIGQREIGQLDQLIYEQLVNSRLINYNFFQLQLQFTGFTRHDTFFKQVENIFIFPFA